MVLFGPIWANPILANPFCLCCVVVVVRVGGVVVSLDHLAPDPLPGPPSAGPSSLDPSQNSRFGCFLIEFWWFL